MENNLQNPKSSAELLDMYYLELRCNLLEAAATFDRIQKAPEFSTTVANDQRYLKLLGALKILGQDNPTRARDFLDHFSEENQ